MRVLAITYGLPWPLTEGTKIRDYHLLRELAKEADVHLLAFCKDDSVPPDPAELKRFCASVDMYVPPPRSAWSSTAAYWRRGIPLATLPFYYEPFAQRIAGLVARFDVHTVQVEHSFLSVYATAIPQRCGKILSLQNIGELQYRTMARMAAAKPSAWLKAWAMRGWECDWAMRFDHCISVSPVEAKWIADRAPGLPITVIENGVDCDKLRPLPAPSGCEVLFTGILRYPPNSDAVIQFARKVLPLVRRMRPDVRFVVVGRNAPEDVRFLAEHGLIELHEDVPDIAPFYRRARATVVPLRAGGGTRLKILEAMAVGRPVVSTPIGCEGRGVKDENQLLIADGPDAMAENLLRILNTPALASELSSRARSWVEQRHDWRLLGARLRSLHQQLAASRVEARA
jgi:glycosyltransferase involved in cell wall biosynthesis